MLRTGPLSASAAKRRPIDQSDLRGAEQPDMAAALLVCKAILMAKDYLELPSQ